MNKAAHAIGKVANISAGQSTPKPPEGPGGRDFASRTLPPGLQKKKKKMPPPWQSGSFDPKGVKAYQAGMRPK